MKQQTIINLLQKNSLFIGGLDERINNIVY